MVVICGDMVGLRASFFSPGPVVWLFPGMSSQVKCRC